MFCKHPGHPPKQTAKILLHIHNDNVRADLFDVFIADIAVVIGANAWKPFASVGYDDFFDTAGAMVKFEIDNETDTVAGF